MDIQYFIERINDDMSDEDSEKKLVTGRMCWTNGAVRALLLLRKEENEKFEKPSSRKSKLWLNLAERMKKEYKYYVTGSDCHEKFRSLMASYRKNKEKETKLGAETINWEYFETMDELFHDKASIRPPTNSLFSSTNRTSLTQTPSKTPPTSSTLSSTISLQPDTESNKLKRKYIELLERHNDIEERKIEAIENLTDIIKRLVGRHDY